MTRFALLSTTVVAAMLGMAQLQAAHAQNTTPSTTQSTTPATSGKSVDLSLTPTQKANHEMPVADKNPTPPLTFPPSSACAFHGNADCEAKAKADAAENLKFGRTGNINGKPAGANGEAYGSNDSVAVAPIGGLSSGSGSAGSSSTIAPSGSDNPSSSSSGSFNANSYGNTSAGTASPSGTGNGAQ